MLLSVLLALLGSFAGMQPRTVPAGSPLSAESNQSLRVMTYNIRHGKGMDGKVNIDRIAAEIRQSGADIVSLQEVDRYWLRSGFEDQASRLAAQLGMYQAFAPSINLGLSQYGNAVLSKYPITEQSVRYMRGYTERRSILVAAVQLTDRTITVVNTHLGYVGLERRKQLAALREVLKELRGPVLLCGDFNMKAGDSRLKQLLPEGRKAMLGDRTDTIAGGGEIDHIFYQGFTGQPAAWVQPSDASDHRPVLAQIGWPSE